MTNIEKFYSKWTGRANALLPKGGYLPTQKVWDIMQDMALEARLASEADTDNAKNGENREATLDR